MNRHLVSLNTCYCMMGVVQLHALSAKNKVGFHHHKAGNALQKVLYWKGFNFIQMGSNPVLATKYTVAARSCTTPIYKQPKANFRWVQYRFISVPILWLQISAQLWV